MTQMYLQYMKEKLAFKINLLTHPYLMLSKFLHMHAELNTAHSNERKQ